MTNRLAVILGLLILGGLLVDYVTDAGVALSLARRFIVFLEWLSFWR